MSTHAYIGHTIDNQKVEYIYCHWDGYPAHIAPLLLHRYNTPAKIQTLINLGDLSALYSNIAPPEGIKHTFDHPVKNTTIAYHRDRKESWDEVKPTIASLTAFRNLDDGYVYLYNSETLQWKIKKGQRFYRLKE